MVAVAQPHYCMQLRNNWLLAVMSHMSDIISTGMMSTSHGEHTHSAKSDIANWLYHCNSRMYPDMSLSSPAYSPAITSDAAAIACCLRTQQVPASTVLLEMRCRTVQPTTLAYGSAKQARLYQEAQHHAAAVLHAYSRVTLS
eukprot:GHRQ01027784.1.p2 GENE.GHRQ01027784.1~~GHRQ01027784.1.p2  ORF type:complete len:142 (-),score=20.60 GHRQ01027784.1:1008-1433(-)